MPRAHVRVLIAGCGYVGSRLAVELNASGCDVLALKRDPSTLVGVETMAADLTEPSTLTLPEVDVAFFTAAPDAGDEDVYRATYVDGLRNLANALHRGTRLIFASSTAVYGQDDGSEVDEHSPTTPLSFRGRVLLEAEEASDVTLRLGGIYGPGRALPLERLRRGEARYHPGRYLNLIHRDDASGALQHLMALEQPERIYIGVDEEPVESDVFHRWLVKQRGSSPPLAARKRTGKNKRCSSAKLRASGYRFRYPTFRDGYGELIAKSVLAPCPASPTCVSSRAADARHRMQPLRFTGSTVEARNAIVVAVDALGGRIVAADDEYVRAEFTSRVFGFVDDVEWMIDAVEERIDFRSASRVGYSDLGMNRRRMHKLIRRLIRDGKIFPMLERD